MVFRSKVFLSINWSSISLAVHMLSFFVAYYREKITRIQLGKKTGADNTCPVTTGIFLRIAIEQNMGDVNFPYWRVIDENHPVVKKLNLDWNQIKNRRIDEGIPH